MQDNLKFQSVSSYSEKIEVLKALFQWLSTLQVSSELHMNSPGTYAFYHPTDGLKNFKYEAMHKLVEISGIHFQDINGRWECYDDGGIFDPLDRKVCGEHYSATHYALAGVILYSFTKDRVYLDRAEMALSFHLKTYKDEYLPRTWGYHWNFNNLALIDSYLRLPAQQENIFHLRQAISGWRDRIAPGTNWFAMRSLANYLRYKAKIRPVRSFVLFALNLMWVLLNQKSDGCLDDFKNRSRPIAYHAYTLALLYRIYVESGRKMLFRNFKKGVDYLALFVDPEGDFNYKGRGQRQIFGYICAIYCFDAAFKETGNPKYNQISSKIWKFLHAYFGQEGFFPLILNKHAYPKTGYYDYHHLTVYNAFCAAWLALDLELVGGPSKKRVTENIEAATPYRLIKYLPSTKEVIADYDTYFCSISAGESMYLTDTGITFQHLFIKNVGCLFSCPGGPTPDKFGKYGYTNAVWTNIFAPIIKYRNSWIVPRPKKTTGKVSQIDYNTFEFTVNCDYIQFRRIIGFNQNRIYISDKVESKRNLMLQEFRIINIPYLCDTFDSDIDAKGNLLFYSKNKKVVSVHITNCTNEAEWKIGKDTFPGPAGNVTVISRALPTPHSLKRTSPAYVSFFIEVL